MTYNMAKNAGTWVDPYEYINPLDCSKHYLPRWFTYVNPLTGETVMADAGTAGGNSPSDPPKECY